MPPNQRRVRGVDKEDLSPGEKTILGTEQKNPIKYDKVRLRQLYLHPSSVNSILFLFNPW